MYTSSNAAKSTTPTSSTRNLLDTAAANGKFKTFRKAIDQAGLAATLNGPGPFTVFAPTDAAFDLLPAGRFDALMKDENKQELISILNYHVVSGRTGADAVRKWESAKTVNGQAAPIRLSGSQLSIDGAVVSAADIDSSNGVIHGIDKVNMPAAKPVSSTK
jgi:uncharacterized surface protein with fasciclin (FAS1) repeats